MKRYEKYKDSGVDWIGEIPEGWECCRFKNVLSLVTTPSCSDKKIGLENIESGTGTFIASDSEFEGNGVEFKENDIVYGKLRPYLKKVWQAEFEGNAVGDFFVFRTKNKCIPDYMKYLMLSDNFTSIADGSTNGAKMPRVSSDFILQLGLYLPPLSEQQSIASYLDEKTGKVDSLIASLESQIEELKSYKCSLISEAVTGKVDLRGWNEAEPKN